MVQQSFQWGEAHARRTDPHTSHDAAKSVEGKPASDLEQVVLVKLVVLGDATSEEVANALGISLQSISPRFAPLARRGLIVKTGEKRAGASGRKRQVWKVV